MTIDDAKAYTRPWTVTLPLTYQADTELLEYICNENNQIGIAGGYIKPQ